MEKWRVEDEVGDDFIEIIFGGLFKNCSKIIRELFGIIWKLFGNYKKKDTE